MKKIESRESMSWTFRLSDKIAQRTQITLQEDTGFWTEQSKTWFYGYKIPDSIKVTLWGAKIDLDIKIAPYGTPTETLPAILKSNNNCKSLSADKQELVQELKAQIAAIKSSIAEEPSEELENSYWNYVSDELFLGSFRKALDIWNSQLNLTLRIEQITKLFITIYDSVRELKLPDELMRNDTKFMDIVVQILLFVEKIENEARMNSIELSSKVHELSVFLDHFSDLMIEGGNKLFGIKHEMTDEQRNEAVDLTTAAFDSKRSIDERLEILKRLCENPIVDKDDRLIFLEKSIELIENRKKRSKPAPCLYDDLIKRHLSAIGCFIQKLEQDRGAVWCERVADEMFDSLKAWREDARMAAWTKDQFAEMLYLTNLTISTHEKENGKIEYELELFFLDKEDSFEGHTIFVSVKNGNIHEILLMG